jgi:hypothetical protein
VKGNKDFSQVSERERSRPEGFGGALEVMVRNLSQVNKSILSLEVERNLGAGGVKMNLNLSFQ